MERSVSTGLFLREGKDHREMPHIWSQYIYCLPTKMYWFE